MADALVVVLAAGLGSRFAPAGSSGKLDAQCGGRLLGQWALAAVAAANLPAGVIVTGPHVPAFAKAAHGWQLVTNAAPQSGLGASVALAASQALAQGRDLLLLLADMPLITHTFLGNLAAQDGAAATRYPGGRAGVPARLPLAVLPQAALLTGERGAAGLLARIEGLALFDPPPGMLADVDTPADLRRVSALLTARG